MPGLLRCSSLKKAAIAVRQVCLDGLEVGVISMGMVLAVIIIWLVVWNIWIIFSYSGNFIIPTDFNIFQRGRYTTNQITMGF